MLRSKPNTPSKATKWEMGRTPKTEQKEDRKRINESYTIHKT